MISIATIPPLQVLRGMFLNVINSPIQRFAIALGQIAESKGAAPVAKAAEVVVPVEAVAPEAPAETVAPEAAVEVATETPAEVAEEAAPAEVVA